MMQKLFSSVRKRLFLLSLLLLSLLFVFCLAAFEPVWPEAGSQRSSKGELTVDYSHSEDGYLLIKAKAGKKRLKLRISMGDETYTYDLNTDGEYEVFPLQLGSGKYTCQLYKNSSGKKYTQQGSVSVKVKLSREDAALLCPNQYVYYTADSPAVLKAAELCAGLETEQEKLDAIRSFVKNTFAYDYVKAITVQAGTVPDVDGCFEKKLGICQDLAAVAVCMLRSQGIPARLMIGNADKTYHAWVSVTVNGEEITFDPTVDLNAMKKPSRYTLERYY